MEEKKSTLIPHIVNVSVKLQDTHEKLINS